MTFILIPDSEHLEPKKVNQAQSVCMLTSGSGQGACNDKAMSSHEPVTPHTSCSYVGDRPTTDDPSNRSDFCHRHAKWSRASSVSAPPRSYNTLRGQEIIGVKLRTFQRPVLGSNRTLVLTRQCRDVHEQHASAAATLL